MFSHFISFCSTDPGQISTTCSVLRSICRIQRLLSNNFEFFGSYIRMELELNSPQLMLKACVLFEEEKTLVT